MECVRQDLVEVIDLLNKVVAEINKLNVAIDSVIATQRSHGEEIAKLVRSNGIERATTSTTLMPLREVQEE
jgi:hypothetical protein